MVKVILAAHLSGTRNGIPWPPPGGEIDVPEDEAADLFRNELAVVAPRRGARRGRRGRRADGAGNEARDEGQVPRQVTILRRP
jgi:hypothetical protein